MEVRIGIQHSPREVTIDLADDTSVDEVKATVEAGMGGSGLIWLTDKKGRQTGFPADRVAYIEIGAPGDDNRIGFS